ncbi:MAG TPA: hypothetical protein VJU59_37900 [Paraburkholderia sp.]|uniref:hypothetical protein n=1 Tax=Paraburkholderia sp. TaxID=1926495 RepID=UPI002B47C404|nr:hypothetical protein [Paraburkholderia sp.]HKR45384.1 hypothetical protein [Paraburkholderia sp.]
MYGIKRGESIPEMEALGTVADLGATVVEGDVRVFGLLTHGSHDWRFSALSVDGREVSLRESGDGIQGSGNVRCA